MFNIWDRGEVPRPTKSEWLSDAGCYGLQDHLQPFFCPSRSQKVSGRLFRWRHTIVSIVGGHEADLVGDLLAEGVGGEDLDEVALAEDGEAEVGGGMTLEVEEAGLVVEGRLVLRGVERGEAEVVAGSVADA